MKLPRLSGLAASIAALVALASSAFATSSAVNISTRMRVEAGDNVLIGGFIVVGSGQKKIVVRALGPSLPVSGTLTDPVLELHDAAGKIIASNDNWKDTQQTDIQAIGMQPKDDRESTLIATVSPGSYTAVVKGANNGAGVGLVEVYDLDPPGSPTRLANISTRGDVLTDDNVMIGGVIIGGDMAKKLIIRAGGPSLPLAGKMSDPMLELHDGNGAALVSNGNWKDSQPLEIAATGIAPKDDREPAIVTTLQPGAYTAIVRGTANGTGIGIVEFYDLDEPPQADGSMLFLASLAGAAGANTAGGGNASLLLAADGSGAILNVDYSNPTSKVSDIEVRSATGETLFDISAATPRPDGSYVWTFAPVGSFSPADILAAIKAGQVSIIVHTTANPSGELAGTFNLSRAGTLPPAPTPPPALPGGTPTVADAARFASQTTFGANDETIAHIQQVGFDAFLNEQFNTAVSSHVAYVDATGVNPPTIAQTMEAWWTYAATGPDQFRQRVAFALSEFFVVSTQSAGLANQPIGMSTYVDVLLKDAFTNYRQLLEDITLNPAMGKYLDMLRNDKAGPGHQPNENYAREIMQLFSIGLYKLNLDGSQLLDATAHPIPTYDQNAILGLAATFTGWYYAQSGTPSWSGVAADYRDPMMPVPSHHETAAKTILDGVVIPANQTPQQDLKIALDTIFNHPNVGPFFCKQLIQRLVTSNPSPGYVYRVASVFNDNGQGVRGDMKAVLRAILLDYEARGGVAKLQGSGHLREPVLRLTNLLRAFHASSPNGHFTLGAPVSSLGQAPLYSPTVFNFFPPDYSAPGAITDNGLNSPEFAITTGNNVITMINYLRNAIYSYLGPSANRVTLNLSTPVDYLALSADPNKLVDQINFVLMNSSMSQNMRDTIVNALNQIANNPTERVRTAIYLTVTSPEFSIEK